MELIKNIPKQFNDAISTAITSELRPRHVGHYNASEIGTCYREWYYRYTQPKQHKDETLRIFQVGHSFHEWVDKLFENSPDFDVIANEKSLLMLDPTTGAVLHGRLDNLVEFKGEKYLIDTKTTKLIANYPLPDTYKMQLMPYMKMFNVKKGGILYVEKNTFKTKFIEVPYDESLLQEVFKRLGVIHKALIDKQLPEPEAKNDKKKKWACGFCQYKEECDKANER